MATFPLAHGLTIGMVDFDSLASTAGVNQVSRLDQRRMRIDCATRVPGFASVVPRPKAIVQARLGDKSLTCEAMIVRLCH